MTDEERELLIEVAKAVAALSLGVASGYNSQQFAEQYEKIENKLRPLTLKLVETYPQHRHLVR